MTLPRYSLYGTTAQWAGNIQVDAGGRWVRWKDITPYLEYCEQQGFQPPEQLELFPLEPIIDMAEVIDITKGTGIIILNEEDDHEIPLDDGEDLYELMTHENRRAHSNTTDSD